MVEFTKKIIYLILLRAKGNSLHYYKKLTHWQWLTKSQIHSLQKKRLEKIILHAYHHTSYYREVLQSSKVVVKSKYVNLNNFKNIPLLDKKTIHFNFDTLKSDDLEIREWYENASGGSTGRPIRLIQDQEYATWKFALKILFDLWTGYSFGKKKLLLWGSDRDLYQNKDKFKIRFGKWLRNEVAFNTFKMMPSQMNACVDTINDSKPVQILAYVEGIYELSRFIERNRLKVFSPEAIMSTAGTLYPQFRETIKEALNAPVFNRYGSREFVDIAFECDKHQGLHISCRRILSKY